MGKWHTFLMASILAVLLEVWDGVGVCVPECGIEQVEVVLVTKRKAGVAVAFDSHASSTGVVWLATTQIGWTLPRAGLGG